MIKLYAQKLIAASMMIAMFTVLRSRSEEQCLIHVVADGDGIPILTDCSGITWRPETETYFVIENRMANIYEVSQRRRILNMYPSGLRGRDTEDISYAGSNMFYVCDEIDNMIYQLELKDGHMVLKRSVAVNLPNHVPNEGLEGIAFCARNNSAFVVKEKNPVTLAEIDLSNEHFGVIKRQVAVAEVTDLAGVAYEPKSHRLLLLSEESRCVLVVNPDNLKILCKIPIDKSSMEGICFGQDDILAIMAEPYMFYYFKLTGLQSHD